LFAAVLESTNQLSLGVREPFMEVVAMVWRRSLSLLLALMVYVLGIVAIIAVAKLLLSWGLSGVAHKNAWLTVGLFFLAGFPIMIGLIMTFFAFPLLAVGREHSVLKAFSLSARLLREHWQHGMGLYAMFLAALLLLMPNTLHGQFIATHHFRVLFDLVVLLVLVPVVVNIVLLVMNDLKLRTMR
jgi:hypothetical protein